MTRARWIVALLAAALAVATATVAVARPPVWTVRSKTATVVLFGSVHLLPPGLDWRPPALDEALGRANELWFELPINPATDNQVAQIAEQRGALARDRRLSGLMSASRAARLRAAAVALNCSPAALDRMQPWMAELTLSVAEDVRGGANASDGVEDQLQHLAPAALPRRAFETAAEQIEFLAGAPVADQIASLNATVDEIIDDPSSYRRIVGEWMAGDIRGLERDALDPVAKVSPALYARLVGERNQRWARRLAARLRQRGLVVVVVGVGHMLGPGGLPVLLRAQGFQVDGPSS